MAAQNIKNESLILGDNLKVMRGMNSESFDLVYLDPPFNKSYAFKNENVEGYEFDDKWARRPLEKEEQERLYAQYPKLKGYMDFEDEYGAKGSKNYLLFIAVRLVEVRRLLKDTGNVFFHCDDLMAGSVRRLMDMIFSSLNYRNEIVWRRTTAHNFSILRKFGRITDRIIFYRKSEQGYWEHVFKNYTEEEIRENFAGKDDRGRYRLNSLSEGQGRDGQDFEWKGVRPAKHGKGCHWHVPARIVNLLVGEEKGKKMSVRERLELLDEHNYVVPGKSSVYYKTYLHEQDGKMVQDLWADVPNIGRSLSEYVGYPTQKTIALMSRILTGGCPRGGWVLDPFCGSGSMLVAANLKKCNWAGIDQNKFAFGSAKDRMEKVIEGKGSLFYKPSITFSEELPVRTDGGGDR